VRITTAGTSRNDEMRGRQRRYILSMSLRTVCFIGAVLVGPSWFRWVLIAGAVFLPYVAVVMANAVNARDDGFTLLDGVSPHRELSAGVDQRDTP